MSDEKNSNDENEEMNQAPKENEGMDQEEDMKSEDMTTQPEMGGGFKITKGMIILGLIVFVGALFAVQKYIHFGDMMHHDHKSMKEEGGHDAGMHGSTEGTVDHGMPQQPTAMPGNSMPMASSGAVSMESPMMKGLSLKDKKEIESIIKQYIESNPEIVAEALQNLNNKMTKDKESKSKDFLKTNIVKLTANRPYLGNSSNNLVVVEFFDYKCSYCRRSNSVLERIMKEYPDVKVVLETVPVLGQNSGEAVRAAIAVWRLAPTHFAKFHDDLINSPTIDESSIFSVARKQGISTDALKKEMGNPAVQALVNENLDMAQQVGMRGVPTFIVDGDVVPGSLSYEALKELLDKAKAKRAK